MSEQKFRKGQKVFLVRMDRTATYDVVRGTVRRVDAVEGRAHTVFVAVPTDEPGDTIVIDTKPEELHPSERAALLQAVQSCRRVARKWTERADELSRRAAEAK